MKNKTIGVANNRETVIKVLLGGRGIMTYVIAGPENTFTSDKHWIVLADIRNTELDCDSGYDVYVLTSSGPGMGGGWQKLTLIEGLLKEKNEYGIYIAN